MDKIKFSSMHILLFDFQPILSIMSAMLSDYWQHVYLCAFDVDICS
jgi:hypothetical protein